MDKDYPFFISQPLKLKADKDGWDGPLPWWKQQLRRLSHWLWTEEDRDHHPKWAQKWIHRKLDPHRLLFALDFAKAELDMLAAPHCEIKEVIWLNTEWWCRTTVYTFADLAEELQRGMYKNFGIPREFMERMSRY